MIPSTIATISYSQYKGTDTNRSVGQQRYQSTTKKENSDLTSVPAGDLASTPTPEQNNSPTGSGQLGTTVTQLNKTMTMAQRSIQFVIDDITGQTIIKVVDTDSDKVIREIPPEELLRNHQFFEEMKGGIIDRTA